ncbi:hypothetical protein [Pseudoglutamicibacter cumminsii]|uniref:hypothetical protein n=1 Tax=Pseudoglutamicibacter cumminsii TaxID=156979 RepID=UPI0015E803C2|nr:hypothetical protein [Pseudoglutamicibacter cumminsii]
MLLVLMLLRRSLLRLPLLTLLLRLTLLLLRHHLLTLALLLLWRIVIALGTAGQANTEEDGGEGGGGATHAEPFELKSGGVRTHDFYFTTATRMSTILPLDTESRRTLLIDIPKL